MSDDLNLSGPEKFLKSIGTTLEEVGTWLKGIGLSLIGGSEPTAKTKPEPKPVVEDKGKKKGESEESEQEQGEAEEQAQAQEKIKAEEKAKAEEEAREQEKAQEEEKLRAQAEQLQNQVEGDLGALQKVVESIVETKLREPVAAGLAKLRLGLEAALKVDALPERSSALGSLVQEIATAKSDAEAAAKESEKLVEVRQRVAQVQSQVESALSEVEKTVLSIAEVSLQEPQAQQLEGLKKRLSTTMSGTNPTAQEQEFGSLLVDIGKQKEEANAAKLKSDETIVARERIAQLQKQVETAMVEAGKVVDSITESSLKDPEALKLEDLKKRQTTAINLKDLDTQEKDFNTLAGDIGKFKDEADLAKKASDEVQATRLRVETSKKQVEQDLTALKQVVDGIAEVALQKPCAEALDKLNKSLESASKLAKPEEQETALTELGKQLALDRQAANKAAQESQAIVEQRKRVTDLKDKAEKELTDLENLVKSTGSTIRRDKLKKVKEDFEKTNKLPDLTKQEQEYPERSKEIAALKLDCDQFLQTKDDYEKAYNAIKAEVDKAVLAADGNPRLPAKETKEFRDVHAQMLEATKKRGYVRAKKLIPTLKKAAEALNKIATDGDKFYKELAKIDGDHKKALTEIGLKSPACTADVAASFQEDSGRMEKAIQAKTWPAAENALKDLTDTIADILQARSERDSCDKAFAAIKNDWNQARKLISGPGIPDAEASAFRLTDAKVDKKYHAKDWVEAERRVAALQSATEDVLEVAKRGNAYYSEFKKIEAAYDEAQKTIEDKIASDAGEEAFTDAKGDLAAEVDSESWDEAVKLLPALKNAVDALKTEKDEYDRYENAFGKFKAIYDQAMAAIGRRMVPAAETEDLENAADSIEEATDDRDWVEAANRLPDAQKAAQAIQKIFKAGEKYFKAFASLQADFDRANRVYDDEETLTEALEKQFDDALSVIETHVENQEWTKGINALPAMTKAVAAVNKADDDKKAHDKKFESFKKRYFPALQAAEDAGLADPEGQAMLDANEAMLDAEEDKDWVLALAKCPDVIKAIEAVEKVMKDPTTAAYYEEFEKIEDEYDEALAAARMRADKLDLLTSKFLAARKVAQKAAKNKDFVTATAALTDLKKAADDLAAAGEKYKEDKEDFDKKINKIDGLVEAQQVALQPPKKLVGAEVKDFQDAYVPFNDAKNAGDFTTAESLFSALETAIKNLNDANTAYLSEKSSYESELQKITDLASAREIAASGSTHSKITAKVGPFDLALKAVDDAVAIEDWTGAEGELSALESAVTELLEAAKEADDSVSPQDELVLKKKVTDLKPRTDGASEPDQVTYIEDLQQAVKDRLDAVNDLIAKKQYAKAEIANGKLLADLTAMEDAKTAYKEHHKKFKSARDGEVHKARQLALNPPKLAKERTDALMASEKRIERLAAKGKLAKADKDVAAWINEAKAWEKSKEAFDNLNTEANPDPVKLKKLSGMPGGAKVFDALVANLPEGKPEKFLKAAINARFDVEVQRFEKKSSTTTELSGNLPDKSLKKMYQMMANLPADNVKGPVEKLIVFDEDSGGADFGGKEIRMYCGRANDPKGTKQEFNQPGTIMPEGEDVELDFQAVDDKEVPYFDFATLHEVGHAVESAGASLIANAGWQTHSSDDVAVVAAGHFGYDLDFVKATLANKKSVPPPDVTTVPSSSNATQWAAARDAVVDWCQSVRVKNSLWEKPGVSKQVAIGGRVYQEAYSNDWVSYDLAARSKGISSYQFRSSGEWFAELYAAYFSGKLKKTHPYAPTFKRLKKP